MKRSDSEKKDAVTELFDREERGYLRRLRDMAVGLTKPRDSLAYREARQELQRQWAPLVAIAVPVAVCIVMCLVQVGGGEPPQPTVEMQVIEPEAPEPLEEVEPPPQETPDIETEIFSDVIVDVPTPPIGEVRADSPVSETPPVQLTPSPVTMKGIPSRGSGGGGLGGGNRLEGDMVGLFIDLTKDGTGKPRSDFDGRNNNAYLLRHAAELIRGGFSPEILSRYSVAPERVYLSHLVLPYVPSSVGPKTYKVEKSVRAGSPWVAVYRGFLQPEESGTYRLAGLYDDILVVRVDGKTVLEFAWDTRFAKVGQPTALGLGWTLSDAAVTGAHRMRGFQNVPLAYGDWMTLKAGERVPVEIIVGDNGGAGGLTGGILLVEKKGETYAKTPDGMPLLPPFATTRLTFGERMRLKELCDPQNRETSGHYAYAAAPIPVMDTCGKKSVRLEDMNVIDVDYGDL